MICFKLSCPHLTRHREGLCSLCRLECWARGSPACWAEKALCLSEQNEGRLSFEVVARRGPLLHFNGSGCTWPCMAGFLPHQWTVCTPGPKGGSKQVPLQLQLNSFPFFSHAYSMWKILGQGLNLNHSNNLCHCSDNARSLTHWATRELLSSFSYQPQSLKWMGIAGLRSWLKDEKENRAIEQDAGWGSNYRLLQRNSKKRQKEKKIIGFLIVVWKRSFMPKGNQGEK